MNSEAVSDRAPAGEGTVIQLRMTSEEVGMLDDWISRGPRAISREEAIRRLVEIGAHCEPYVERLLEHLEHVAEAEHRNIQETVDALRRALGSAEATVSR